MVAPVDCFLSLISLKLVYLPTIHCSLSNMEKMWSKAYAIQLVTVKKYDINTTLLSLESLSMSLLSYYLELL